MTFEDLKVEWNTPAKHRGLLSQRIRSQQISDTAGGSSWALAVSQPQQEHSPLFALKLFKAGLGISVSQVATYHESNVRMVLTSAPWKRHSKGFLLRIHLVRFTPNSGVERAWHWLAHARKREYALPLLLKSMKSEHEYICCNVAFQANFVATNRL